MELEQFEANPGVPVSMAASMLHISRQRVEDLVRRGLLEHVPLDGVAGVSVASIKKRLRSLRLRRKKSQ
jgi:hypothetical protein